MALSVKNRPGAVVVAGLAALGITACNGDASTRQALTTSTAPATGRGANVNIVKAGGTWEYVPEVVEVASGGEISWRNSTDAPHNVVFEDDALPSSHVFNQHETYRAAFTKVGRYGYLCTIHPTMRGEVVVK